MGTKITLRGNRIIHIAGHDGRSLDLSVGDRAPGQQGDGKGQDSRRKASPVREAVPATPPAPGRRPGYPKLPVRSSFATPGYPKAPPHVLIVSANVDDSNAEAWGNGYRRTRKVLPVSVKWKDLGGGSEKDLGELLRYTRETKARFTKSAHRVLNVFVSKHDIEQGLDIDEVRAKAKALSPEIHDFNILFVDKGERRRK